MTFYIFQSFYAIIRSMDDGHDKNTDNSADNSAQQGIFSTPELTVDTEKITSKKSSNDKARVASFFADTDASKQAQQVQDAMTIPTNYATEDLVINNGGKKKRSFLPIIAAIVAVLVVVGGAAAYFLISSAPQNNTESPTTAFNNFREYLEKGPEEYRQDDQDEPDTEWFLFEANQTEMEVDDMQKYTSELSNKYVIFLDALTTSKVYKNNSALIERSKIYQKILDALTKDIAVEIYDSKLLNTYLNEGASDATRYVDEIAPTTEDDTSYAAALNNLNQYLRTQLSKYQVLDSHGCINNEEINYSCSDELLISSNTYQDLSTQNLTLYDKIIEDIDSLGQTLVYETQVIKALLEDNNA